MAVDSVSLIHARFNFWAAHRMGVALFSHMYRECQALSTLTSLPNLLTLLRIMLIPVFVIIFICRLHLRICWQQVFLLQQVLLIG